MSLLTKPQGWRVGVLGPFASSGVHMSQLGAMQACYIHRQKLEASNVHTPKTPESRAKQIATYQGLRPNSTSFRLILPDHRNGQHH